MMANGSFFKIKTNYLNFQFKIHHQHSVTFGRSQIGHRQEAFPHLSLRPSRDILFILATCNCSSFLDFTKLSHLYFFAHAIYCLCLERLNLNSPWFFMTEIRAMSFEDESFQRKNVKYLGYVRIFSNSCLSFKTHFTSKKLFLTFFPPFQLDEVTLSCVHPA